MQMDAWMWAQASLAICKYLSFRILETVVKTNKQREFKNMDEKYVF